VEDDDLADTGVGDLVVPARYGLQMNVADGAAGEPPKLQMDESIGIGNRDRLAGNGNELSRGDDATDVGALAHGRLLIRVGEATRLTGRDRNR
jgi:hypothetical protein